MKKLLLFVLLLFPLINNAQEEQATKSFEEVVAPYLERTLSGIEKGIEYASEEIPIVLQQYIMYEAVTSWLLVLWGLFLTIGVIIYLYKHFKRDDLNFDNLDNVIPHVLIGGCFILWGIINICSNISTAIMATFFPKLFIVKEFINLL